jgi:hypothetical protein
MAIDESIGTAQDAQEGSTSATILVGTRDEPWDLYELDEYPADACQGGDRAQGGEGVVADLDLDV